MLPLTGKKARCDDPPRDARAEYTHAFLLRVHLRLCHRRRWSSSSGMSSTIRKAPSLPWRTRCSMLSGWLPSCTGCSAHSRWTKTTWRGCRRRKDSRSGRRKRCSRSERANSLARVAVGPAAHAPAYVHWAASAYSALERPQRCVKYCRMPLPGRLAQAGVAARTRARAPPPVRSGRTPGFRFQRNVSGRCGAALARPSRAETSGARSRTAITPRRSARCLWRLCAFSHVCAVSRGALHFDFHLCGPARSRFIPHESRARKL